MNISHLVEALVALLAALVSMFVIPWLKKVSAAREHDKFLSWVREAVTAAEQLYNSEQGQQKKQEVLRFLSAKGYNVEMDEIEVAVEAAVLRLHNELYGVAK